MKWRYLFFIFLMHCASAPIHQKASSRVEKQENKNDNDFSTTQGWWPIAAPSTMVWTTEKRAFELSKNAGNEQIDEQRLYIDNKLVWLDGTALPEDEIIAALEHSQHLSLRLHVAQLFNPNIFEALQKVEGIGIDVNVLPSRSWPRFVTQIKRLKKNLRYLSLMNPKVSAEDLRGLDLLGLRLLHTPFDKDVFAAIAEFKKLKFLTIYSSKETLPSDLDVLKKLHHLSWISFSFYRSKGVHLNFLASNPDLKVLFLTWTPIDRAGIAQISKLKNLRVLFLRQPNQIRPIDDLDLKSIAKLEKLEALSLVETKISAKGLALLGKMKNLDEIIIREGDVKGSDLVLLKDLNLRRLTMTGVEFKNEDFRHIEAFENLKYLELQGKDINDEGLIHLKDLHHLEGLNLSSTKIEGTAFKRLKNLAPTLKHLNLSNSPFGDGGMVALRAFKSLEALILYQTKVSDIGAQHLKRLTKLKSLHLRDTDVSDSGLEAIGHLYSLKVLNLIYTRITDQGLVHLRGLLDLRALYLDRNSIGDDGLESLSYLFRLRHLSLKDCDLKGPGLKHLQGMKHLWLLNLEGTHIDNAALSLLSPLPVRLLNISHLRINDVGFSALVKMKHLTELGVKSNTNQSKRLAKERPFLSVYR